MKAYYMDNDTESDQRLPHKPEPTTYLTRGELAKLGVYYWLIDPANYQEDFDYQRLRDERGYSYEDEIECSPQLLPNYEDAIKSFYAEHIHRDEEVRYILKGSGYFDVRDHNDKWIRIEVTEGDLIILPAGIYHRFTLDLNNYIKAKRLFIGEPIWTPYARSTLPDNDPTVQKYRNQFILSN